MVWYHDKRNDKKRYAKQRYEMVPLSYYMIQYLSVTQLFKLNKYIIVTFFFLNFIETAMQDVHLKITEIQDYLQVNCQCSPSNSLTNPLTISTFLLYFSVYYIVLPSATL